MGQLINITWILVLTLSASIALQVIQQEEEPAEAEAEEEQEELVYVNGKQVKPSGNGSTADGTQYRVYKVSPEAVGDGEDGDEGGQAQTTEAGQGGGQGAPGPVDGEDGEDTVLTTPSSQGQGQPAQSQPASSSGPGVTGKQKKGMFTIKKGMFAKLKGMISKLKGWKKGGQGAGWKKGGQGGGGNKALAGPAGSNSPSAGSTSDEGYQERGLQKMNELRILHRAPPLTLDPTLNKNTEDWANKVAASGKIAHSCKVDCSYGENAAMQPPNPDLGDAVKKATQAWYDEVKDYDFATGESRGGETGHFTAIIWKESTAVGIGAARAANGYIYVFAQFTPPGNMEGEYIENVLP